MCKESRFHSALFIGTADDDGDAPVLVVGGMGGHENEAALLTNCYNRGRGWRWRQLSPMQVERPLRPGLLLLGRGRVLVCGGAGAGGRKAEILQLPLDDNDGGVWTLLTQEMTQKFEFTYLFNFGNRIVAVGESIHYPGNNEVKTAFD